TQTTSDSWGLWNGAVFGPDQEAYFKFTTLATNTPEHDLMLKVQGTSWSAGEIEVKYDGVAKKVYVSTYSPVAGWQSIGSSISVPFVAGDQFGARAQSDGTVGVYKNGTRIGTVSVAAWAFAGSGGRIGLTLVGASASRLDDFGGGNVQATPIGNTPPVASIQS